MKHEINIDYVTIDSIKPYPGNNKKHPDSEIEKLASMIDAYGFDQPIVVDKDMVIIKGHGRLLAHKKLGSELIPIVMRDDLSPALVKASRIADNKSNESEWDLDLLAIEFEELKEMDFDLELTGFDMDEIAALMPEQIQPGLTDEDEVPQIPEQPVTKLGDVWLCGNHRVMCGDSTSIDAVEKLMNGNKADMVFTSPPYNADTKMSDGDIFKKGPLKKLYGEGYSDALPSDKYVDFASSVLEICFVNTDGFIFWNVSYNAKSKYEYIQQIINRIGFLVEQICWKKSSTIPFKGCLMRDWEPVYVFSTNKQSLNLKSVTSNFWEISNTGAQHENHKACFPVGLPEKAIGIVNSNTGIVLDVFGGSGSTLIACEKTNRINYSMELDERYVDVIVNRWQAYTGKLATLDSTGELFNDLAGQQ